MHILNTCYKPGTILRVARPWGRGWGHYLWGIKKNNVLCFYKFWIIHWIQNLYWVFPSSMFSMPVFFYVEVPFKETDRTGTGEEDAFYILSVALWMTFMKLRLWTGKHQCTLGMRCRVVGKAAVKGQEVLDLNPKSVLFFLFVPRQVPSPLGASLLSSVQWE